MLKAATMATLALAAGLLTVQPAAAQSTAKPKPPAFTGSVKCDPGHPNSYCNPQYSCPTPAPCVMTKAVAPKPAAKPASNPATKPATKTDSVKIAPEEAAMATKSSPVQMTKAPAPAHTAKPRTDSASTTQKKAVTTSKPLIQPTKAPSGH